MFRARIISFAADRRGSVSAEAALIVPALILLGLGAADYSNMLISHHKMQTSVTNAGIYLAKSGAPANAESKAKNLAVTGQLTGGMAKLPGWENGDITITYSTTANANSNYRGADVRIVKLSTELDYQGFGFVNALVPGRVKMRDTFEARINTGRS